MELPGETFLFNLSLLAITFSAVSALVTLLRQTMGGRLSKFDVYLVNAYVQQGFALAIAAILPPIIAQFGLSPPVLWAIASAFAVVVFGWRTAQSLWERMSIIKEPMPLALKVSFGVNEGQPMSDWFSDWIAGKSTPGAVLRGGANCSDYFGCT